VASSQGSHELLQKVSQFDLFFIILFQFADVDILQSILDIGSHMLVAPLCIVCMTALAPD